MDREKLSNGCDNIADAQTLDCSHRNLFYKDRERKRERQRENEKERVIKI